MHLNMWERVRLWVCVSVCIDYALMEIFPKFCLLILRSEKLELGKFFTLQKVDEIETNRYAENFIQAIRPRLAIREINEKRREDGRTCYTMFENRWEHSNRYGTVHWHYVHNVQCTHKRDCNIVIDVCQSKYNFIWFSYEHLSQPTGSTTLYLSNPIDSPYNIECFSFYLFMSRLWPILYNGEIYTQCYYKFKSFNFNLACACQSNSKYTYICVNMRMGIEGSDEHQCWVMRIYILCCTLMLPHIKCTRFYQCRKFCIVVKIFYFHECTMHNNVRMIHYKINSRGQWDCTHKEDRIFKDKFIY